MTSHVEKIKGKNVLVTGGLGFVGHNLVKSLLHDHGCRVTIVDDCRNSKPEVLGADRKLVQFERISVLDSDFLSLLNEQNYVFHLACIQISAAGDNATLDLRVNAESTLNILEYIRHNPLPSLERFVYTSSASVYGSSLRLPLDENCAPNLLSHYAASKYLGEAYTQLYNTKYELPTVAVRYSNIFGYGQSPRNPYCGVLGHFVHNALTEQTLNVYGDGEQTRDYTFVTDAVQATILAAVHPKAIGEVFNIGTSVETSVNRLIEMIRDQVPGIAVKNLPDRDIDNIRRRCVNIEHIHKKLGWIPKVNIANGLERTLNWYRSILG